MERSSRRESTRGGSDKYKDRMAAKEKERERSYRDEEAYEQRRVDKKQREREAAYKEVNTLCRLEGEFYGVAKSFHQGFTVYSTSFLNNL